MAESSEIVDDVDDEGCLTLYWDINNFSIFMSTEEGVLNSPLWKIETAEDSAWWCVRVYHSDADFEFHLLQFNGCWILERWDITVTNSKGEVPGEKKFLRVFINKRDGVAFDNKNSIVPKDTLRVCCKIWRKSIKTEELRFETVLRSFSCPWKIEDFDFALPLCYNRFIEDDYFLLLINLVRKSCEEETHKFTISDIHRKEGCFSFVNNRLHIGENRGSITSEECLYPCVSWTCYLEFDIDDWELNPDLQLVLESVIAVHSGQFPLSSSKIVKDSATSTEDIDTSGTLNSDLLQLFKAETFSDATISTEGKSWPVHRSILAARSPVFRTMFEKQMSEGCSGVVNIVDIDIGTVNRMLVFLYEDSFDFEMKYKEAMSLYYAADKYAIQYLKVKCANLLKSNLAPDNACSALVLADTHSDEQLKNCVLEFLCEHPEVIVSSDWNKLEEENSLLAAKCLRAIFKKKENI